jgi:hypothetical protein
LRISDPSGTTDQGAGKEKKKPDRQDRGNPGNPGAWIATACGLAMTKASVWHFGHIHGERQKLPCRKRADCNLA